MAVAKAADAKEASEKRRNEFYFRAYGIDYEEFVRLSKRGKKYLRAYQHQKKNAHRRKIDFRLSLREWFDAWGNKLSRRSRTGYVMTRKNDLGPYAVGNIVIKTAQANLAEGKELYYEKLANRKTVL